MSSLLTRARAERAPSHNHKNAEHVLASGAPGNERPGPEEQSDMDRRIMMAAPFSSTLHRKFGMPLSLNRLSQHLLRIPVQEATFSRRGFDQSEPLKQQRL